MSKDLPHTHAHAPVHVLRAWLSLHPLFSAYPLLGAYLLTTYTCKRIRLLTGVYDMSVEYQAYTVHFHAFSSQRHNLLRRVFRTHPVAAQLQPNSFGQR